MAISDWQILYGETVVACEDYWLPERDAVQFRRNIRLSLRSNSVPSKLYLMLDQFPPWKMRQCVPPRSPWIFTSLHGVYFITVTRKITWRKFAIVRRLGELVKQATSGTNKSPSASPEMPPARQALESRLPVSHIYRKRNAEVWDSHDAYSEDYKILGCNGVYSGVSEESATPSSGWKCNPWGKEFGDVGEDKNWG